MATRLEIEQKFSCPSVKQLKEKLNHLHFEKIENTHEVDTYFTDQEGTFLKKLICLRIRKTNHESLELTYKGKSELPQNFHAKIERNLVLKTSELEEWEAFLNDLGYLPYVTVDKKRELYQRVEEGLEHHVMIDTLPRIGTFIEFEILGTVDDNLESLKLKLNDFVSLFKKLKLEEAPKPYRDYVAEEDYQLITNGKDIHEIYLDPILLLNSSIKFHLETLQENKVSILSEKKCIHEHTLSIIHTKEGWFVEFSKNRYAIKHPISFLLLLENQKETKMTFVS